MSSRSTTQTSSTGRPSHRVVRQWIAAGSGRPACRRGRRGPASLNPEAASGLSGKSAGFEFGGGAHLRHVTGSPAADAITGVRVVSSKIGGRALQAAGPAIESKRIETGCAKTHSAHDACLRQTYDKGTAAGGTTATPTSSRVDIVDLSRPPPWSNEALRRLGEALRDDKEPPADGPSYDDVLRWYFDLAVEVQRQIEEGNWSIKPKLVTTKAARMETDLLVGSRPKTADTLVQKLRRRPALNLDSIQDLAGVRIDADMYLAEQMQLAREIAEHFGADESAIVDRRGGEKAGYRAVHVDLQLPAGRVEMQVRTILQSIWANIYEKLADDVGRGIRYGERAVPPAGYDQSEADEAVQAMQTMSEMIAAREADWQDHVDSNHSLAIGADAMQKAMMVGAVVVAARDFNTGARPDEERE